MKKSSLKFGTCARFAAAGITAVAWLLLSGWAVLALYLDVRIPWLRLPFAAGYVIALLALALRLKHFWRLGLAGLGLFLLTLTWWLHLHPSNTRNWRPDVAALPHADGPSVLLVVGVNGTGKTTTVGKLARVLVADGRRVVLGAADTFRAAAVDQLQTWAERVGAHVVRGREGADPASVAFDAVDAGIKDGADVVLIDTAGRLHTKTGLMDELGKVKRVVSRRAAVAISAMALRVPSLAIASTASTISSIVVPGVKAAATAAAITPAASRPKLC